MEEVLVNYFQNLFTSSNPTIQDETYEVVKDKLSEEHRLWCEKPYSSEEVLDAIHLMHPLKAPGPDGLLALVYQKYWRIVGRDVEDLVLQILNNNGPTDTIN